MSFLHNSHPVHIMFSEIDLRNHPHLRMLRLHLNLEDVGSVEMQNGVIRWFTVICESVTSKSLVFQVHNFSMEADICNKIQDSLIALNSRIETLSVYLSDRNRFWTGMTRVGGILTLFSRLDQMGIVVEKYLNDDESVS